MVDPRHIANVLDVGDDVGDGGARDRMRRRPGCQACGHRRGIAGVQGFQPGVLGGPGAVPGAHRLGDEAGHEGDHHHPTVLGHQAQHAVGHIARMGRHRPRRRMGEDHGGLGHPHGVQHGLFRDVAEVDHHPQPVHLAHNLLAERRQAAPLRRIGGAVGPGGGLRVGQGDVAGPGIEEFSQETQGVIDRIATLHADQRGDPAAPVDAFDIGRGGGQFEHVRMGGDDPLDGVDLLEGFARGLGRGQGRGHIDRPELTPDAAGPQARNVGVQFGRGVEIRRQVHSVGVIAVFFAQRPGQVVMAVDQRCAPQNLADARLACRIDGLGQNGSGGERGDDRGQKNCADHGVSPELRPGTVADGGGASTGRGIREGE